MIHRQLWHDFFLIIYDTLPVKGLIKNDAWGFISGALVKPEIPTPDPAVTKKRDESIAGDLKAQSDLVLAISPAEIK